MKTLVYPKQYGKTTAMIKTVAERGGYIVCANHAEVQRVFAEAQDAGLNIRYPLTFDEFVGGRFLGRSIREFYLDNVEDMLTELARGVPIHTITLTKDDDTVIKE